MVTLITALLVSTSATSWSAFTFSPGFTLRRNKVASAIDSPNWGMEIGIWPIFSFLPNPTQPTAQEQCRGQPARLFPLERGSGPAAPRRRPFLRRPLCSPASGCWKRICGSEYRPPPRPSSPPDHHTGARLWPKVAMPDGKSSAP